jgi:ElaB/YqjD/DUF883 family membrane-anchored ribosome-binding protein
MFGSRRHGSTDLARQIDDLQSQLDDLLRSTGKQARRKAEPLRSSIVGDAREIYEQIDSIIGAVTQLFALFGKSRRKLGDALNVVENTIDRNPSKALMAAVGVGLMVYFWARENR